MSGEVSKLLKRKCYAKELSNGETIYLRALSFADSTQIAELDRVDIVAFAIGKSLVSGDGTAAIPATDGESATDYAKRTAVILADLGQDMMSEIMDIINKLAKVPDQKVLEKNLPATESAAS